MDDLVYRLRKRAEIRRQIPNRKSVQQGEPDRIADLLEEAADYIDKKLPDENPPPWVREWVGLTDEEIKEYKWMGQDVIAVIKEVQATLKEKNCGTS